MAKALETLIGSLSTGLDDDDLFDPRKQPVKPGSNPKISRRTAIPRPEPKPLKRGKAPQIFNRPQLGLFTGRNFDFPINDPDAVPFSGSTKEQETFITNTEVFKQRAIMNLEFLEAKIQRDNIQDPVMAFLQQINFKKDPIESSGVSPEKNEAKRISRILDRAERDKAFEASGLSQDYRFMNYYFVGVDGQEFTPDEFKEAADRAGAHVSAIRNNKDERDEHDKLVEKIRGNAIGRRETILSPNSAQRQRRRSAGTVITNGLMDNSLAGNQVGLGSSADN